MTILNLAFCSDGLNGFFQSLRRVYDHSETLEQLLQALLDLLSESTPLSDLCLTLHRRHSGIVSPSKRRNASSPYEWTSTPGHRGERRFTLRGSRRVCREPIVYGNETLGAIQYVGHEREADSLETISLLKLTAKWAAYFIKRQDVAEWSKERLGRSFRLAGVSQELLRLEHSIEMASMSCLPVLIGGEPGTEKIHAAVAIHAFSERRSYPFVEVDCARLEVSMPFCMQQARRGTLCLHNLHLLSLDHQYALRDLLYPRLGQWTNHSAPNDVRIISITEDDLDVCGANGIFLPSLLSELSFLSFHVPPIRCRKDDIPSLLKALQGDLEIAPTQEMDGNVRQVFRQHDWPGNLFELARVAAHLGILSGGQEVSLNDLHVHTPWLLEGFPEASASASDQDQLEPPDGDPPTVEGGLERWIDDFIQGRPDFSSTLHDGVCKAIRFLHDNFAAAMTLDDLAKVANLSPSHLSYLFRKEIQATFKDLQQCIRIKQAKHLLRRHRKMTTQEVAAAVGYMDLSYFERCFRRRVGQTPREYRRVNNVSLRP